MDTSMTYIKMCEKATEIQVFRLVGKRWLRGDCFSGGYFRWTIAGGKESRCKTDVWLPRQDQLQEVVECWSYGIGWKKESDNLIKLEKYYQFVNEGNEGIGYLFSKEVSFEQFWLAFVMKENHNKVWNGEDWA